MKFRWILLVLIAVALLIAWRTRPTAADFSKWYTTTGKTQMPPVIEETNNYLYSTFTVSFIEVKQVPDGKAVAIPASKEKYLGLFGRFWKL